MAPEVVVPPTHPLVQAVLCGNHQAAARLISILEDGHPQAQDLLRQLYPHTGRAFVVGITGPPGAGKSTLLDALTRLLRTQDKRVGVVAVDPTSPFSGGAILGDRIRMMDHALDPGVFVRSMATRGSLGGLSPAATEAVHVLDAMGCDVVFIETVGTGQAEVDVVRVADTVVVVLVPGLGDTVQTLKAGVMEIADVFAVNKADTKDAERTVAEVRSMLRLLPAGPGWQVPVVRTIATTGEGIPDLWREIQRHREFLESTGQLKRRRADRRKAEVLRRAESLLRDRILQATGSTLEDLLERVSAGHLSPQEAAQVLVDRLLTSSEPVPRESP